MSETPISIQETGLANLARNEARRAHTGPKLGRACGLISILAGLMCVLLAYAWYATRPRDLMDIATFAGAADPFDRWVSDTEYLDWPNGEGEGSGWAHRPIITTRYNDRTGQRTHYHLAQTGIARFTDSYTIPSPDGKWLLWVSLGAEKDTAIELATGRTCKWTEQGDEFHLAPAWMPDSRHWVTVPTLSEGYMILHSVVPGEKDVRCKALYKWDWRTLADTWVTSKGNLVSIEQPDSDQPQPMVTIHEYTLGITSKVVRVVTTPCPSVIASPRAVLSPSGAQIAWYGIKKEATRLRAFLHRWLHIKPIPNQRTGGIWISNADGSNLHELGTLALQADDDPWLPNIQWLPSGKTLSFQHGGGLYTVPLGLR